MPAASSIIGRCAECCSCPAPVLRWDSRSASKEKVGMPAFGAATNPPRRFLTLVERWDNEIKLDAGTGYTCSALTFEIVSTSPGLEATWYRDRTVTYSMAGGPPTITDIPSSPDEWTFEITRELRDCPSATSLGPLSSVFEHVENGFYGDFGILGTLTVVSPTYQTVDYSREEWYRRYDREASPCPTSDCGNYTGETFDLIERQTGFASQTLDNEYTTAMLLANALAALPAYDLDWDDTPGSYRSLSDNELTLAIRDSRYEWRVPMHKVGSGRCYAIRWIERFTPAGGGEPIDTPRCARWDYVEAPDFDPEDVTTWPVMKNGELDFWELSPPAENGETLVVGIEYFCRCKEGAEACA